MFGEMFRQTTFDPWREFSRLQRQVDRLFNPAQQPMQMRTAFATANLWHDDETAVVAMALPGVSPDGLDVMVSGKMLTISGSRPEWMAGTGEAVKLRERPAEAFCRQIPLPYTIDADKIDATFTNGMLVVNLPRAVAERPRKIQIRTVAELPKTPVVPDLQGMPQP